MAVSRKLALASLLLLAFTELSQAKQSFCSDDPRYPEPQDKGMVFYLQRSGNGNTVVYTASQLADGAIDPDHPVDIFWRWYNRGGDKRPLSFMERQLAFGVKLTPLKDQPGKYTARLNAYPKLPVLVEPTADGKVRAIMTIDGEPAQLVCIYVGWRQQLGIIPEVLYVDFFGRTLDGGKKVVKRRRP